MNQQVNEETGRVIFVAIVTWGIAVAAASMEDVFGKFDTRSVAIFAVAVAMYAFATYRIDREVRAFIQHFPRGGIVAATCLILTTLAVASFEHFPALAVFAAPLAAVAAAAAIEKLATRPKKAPAKSPAVTPAAT